MSINNSSQVEKVIYVIRDQKVMIDYDLAVMFEVETRTFNQAIKRNLRRFPTDFMFQLSIEEYESLNTKQNRGGRRYLPYAFTEQGVAMLATVLNSERAIMINIAIIRTFVKLRSLAIGEDDIVKRVWDLEQGTNKIFQIVFERLDALELDELGIPKKRSRIGLKGK